MNIPTFGKRSDSWVLACAVCTLLTCLPFAPGVSADARPHTILPGEPLDVWVRMAQSDADRAIEHGNFEKAHKLFLKKLAPKGDKHAHYMLGHLNELGLGVPQDPARALAWYALAAERGSASARATGLRLSQTLSTPERARADEILAGLMARYGDRTLLVKAIRRDQRELRNRTGSLVGGGTSPMRIIAPDGTTTNGYPFYDALKARINYRLQLIGGSVTLRELELTDPPENDQADGEEP